MSGDGITTKEFWTVAGPSAEGTLMTYGPDPRKNPAAAAAVAAFRGATSPYKPEAYTLYSYAALQAFAGATREISSNDPRRMATRLRNGQPISTVLGNIAWDSKGDRTTADYIMYVGRNGEYVEL